MPRLKRGMTAEQGAQFSNRTFISASATAASRMTAARRCRRRTATVRRTKAADAPEVASAPSMIARSRFDLAAEHPVAPAGIGENEGNQERHTDQQKELAVARRGGLPDR